GATRREIITADIAVVDDAGAPLARIDNVVLKRASVRGLLGAARPLHALAWQPLDAPSPADPADTAWRILAPGRPELASAVCDALRAAGARDVAPGADVAGALQHATGAGALHLVYLAGPPDEPAVVRTLDELTSGADALALSHALGRALVPARLSLVTLEAT